MPKTICVAVDIEKCGALYIHPVVSVGFYVADSENGQELSRHRFNIKVSWPDGRTFGDFEARCWIDFWSKQPVEIIEGCKENALPPEQAWKQIGKFIDSLEKSYPNDNIKFLSDNPSFDIANIDYNLEKYTGRSPMRYSSTGKYRSVVAADDMFDMIPKTQKSIAMEEINSVVSHDHNPVNDAHHIFLQYFHAKKQFNNMSE